MNRPALLISVGGSPQPVAFSIDRHRPDKVIFFASQDSRSEVETRVRPLTAHRWRDQEILTTPDPQHLTRCLDILSRELPSRLEIFGLDWESLVVDYTGGTKTMSAALVLATINAPVEYSYVGGAVRSKAGLGTVQDGAESMLINPNPWDVLALDLRRRLARQFNRGHFAEARETAREAAARVGAARRPIYQGLEHLCAAYDLWQGFDYPTAQRTLQRALATLEPLAGVSEDASLVDFLATVRADLQRLRGAARAFQASTRGEVPEPGDGHALVVDLVANAVRVTRLAGRPDDGVARLYSAIEKLAKVALAAHGIDNSKASPEAIPPLLRGEYERRFLDPEDGRLRFGLDASYTLLEALDDPLGRAYRRREGALSQMLGARNGSLLVHGWSPVKAELFDRMLEITLEFLGLAESALPPLPELGTGDR